ncbi:MAG: FHA domain-containing protein, partial [Myxococcota bacterium]
MTDQSHRRSAGRAFQTTRPVEAQRPAVEVEGMPLSQGFPVRKLFMEVLDGPERGRALTTQKGDVLLGADPQCDFVLQDPTVSRKHAEVRRRGQNFTLVDLDSTNGTFLGDMRVDSIVLTPGVTFRVGRTSVRFEVVTEKVSVLPTDQTRYGNIIGTSPALREI